MFEITPKRSSFATVVVPVARVEGVAVPMPTPADVLSSGALPSPVTKKA